jgi:hypothetical protein
MANPDLHYLPRLEQRFYQAFAVVHWNMNVLPAVPGWLGDRFHRDFREIMLHACVRERLVCPAYCLMPDHLHLMWMGLSVTSDQFNGMKFLRTQLNRLLAGNLLENRESAVDSRPRPQSVAVFVRTLPMGFPPLSFPTGILPRRLGVSFKDAARGRGQPWTHVHGHRDRPCGSVRENTADFNLPRTGTRGRSGSGCGRSLLRRARRRWPAPSAAGGPRSSLRPCPGQ